MSADDVNRNQSGTNQAAAHAVSQGIRGWICVLRGRRHIERAGGTGGVRFTRDDAIVTAGRGTGG